MSEQSQKYWIGMTFGWALIRRDSKFQVEALAYQLCLDGYR